MRNSYQTANHYAARHRGQEDHLRLPPRAPNRKKRAGRPPTASTRLRGGQAREEEELLWCTGLILRRVSGQAIRVWTGFQVVSLFFQWSLWREVRQHLSLYESTLASQCSAEHARHGICIGPMWNLTYWKEVVLHGTGFGSHMLPLSSHRSVSRLREGKRYHRENSITAIDSEIAEIELESATRIKELRARRAQLQIETGLPAGPGGNGPDKNVLENSSFVFEFETRSSPPTFLLTVDPIARSRHSDETPPTASPHVTPEEEERRQWWHWSLQVRRMQPPEAQARFHKSNSGMDVMTFEDLSPESQSIISTKGSVRWQATVLTGDRTTLQTRFAVTVEDFRAPHLEQMHSSTSCTFISAWKAFNMQHQGHGHQALKSCSFLLGLFLPVSALATYLVHTRMAQDAESSSATDDKPENELEAAAGAEDAAVPAQAEMKQRPRPSDSDDCCDCGGYGFHCVLVAKFLTMDIPQQVCIVLYLLGWYNSQGLRCQLCLFHPDHCEDEHPFRFANSAAILCTLLSSVANQLIVGPSKRRMSEEDICMQQFTRGAMACVSVLPFTTGIYYANSALLSTPMLDQVLVFVPCALGWFSVGVLVLSCIIACCNDMS